VFQKSPFDPRSIATVASEFTLEFNCANYSEDVAAPARHAVEPWCLPRAGMLKLNVDAGFLMMVIWVVE
jgi:hypothetical protein